MRFQRLAAFGGGYPFALAAVAVTTTALLPFRPVLALAQVMLLFVPTIVGVARAAGVRASVAGAFASFLALDLLFVQPYYHFTVASPVDWLTLVVFLVVAVLAAAQTGYIRQRERAAVQRQAELALLNRLSSRLVSEESGEIMAGFIVTEIVAVLGADRAAFFAREAGEARLLAEAGGPASGLAERALADWVLANDKAVGLGDVPDSSHDPRPPGVPDDGAVEGIVADGVYLPLQTDGMEGVLFARPLADRPFSPEQTRQLIAVSNLAAAFLERQRLEGEAAHVVAMRDADRLKTTLVSSVSHELKTPLAAVTARITGLLEEGEGCDAARVREELGAVSEDLGRLDASIRDLLDFSRLESDSWRPRFDEYDVSEVLGTVASRIPAARRGRVTFEVPEGLPPVRLDFAQWARAVSNLVDNALTYSPPAEPVLVGARVLGGELLVWVEDRGPGVKDEERERVFDKFYRGTASEASASGTGLGLAITREITRAHGGRVWVEDALPKGARFVISLPLGGSRQ